MIRPLVIDDIAKAEVARVKAHAEANHYYPGQSTPGDDQRFVARLNTFRAVFTYTHQGGVVYRDLSVSVPGGKLPHPAAMFVIADLFGFTGYDFSNPEKPGKGWMLHHSKEENCIRCAQPIGTDAIVN